MKTNLATLLMMGRTLVRVKDRTGAYKLPNGKAFPQFGLGGRQRVVHPSAVRAPAPSAQPSLFEGLEAPAAPAPGAPLPPQPPVAPPASTASTAQGVRAPGFFFLWLAKLSGAFAAVGRWIKMPKLPPLPRFAPRVPRMFKFGRRSKALDVRPQAQAELALEKVTVLRNDLSESDLVVVTVERKAEDRQRPNAPGGETVARPWARVTARWIKLKSPAAHGGLAPVVSGAETEGPGKLAEIEP
jgi:hypothetical protein